MILSSWEYQQSPGFLDDDRWYRALRSVPPEERFTALADSLADLIDLLAERGLSDRIAYTELHNEVALGRLTEGLPDDAEALTGLGPYLEDAVERMRSRHPDQLFTACFHGIPAGRMSALPKNLDVGHFHAYVYGVLGALGREIGIYGERPTPAIRDVLREDAPPYDEWRAPTADEWRMEATILPAPLVYAHDWADPDRWDRWLYGRYGEYRHAMADERRTLLAVAADWAAERRVPAVIGEAGVGYTPLYGTFEEGPVGRGICEQHVRRCAELGYWGTVISSNAAPHHPMWADAAWQRRLNGLFLS